MSDFNVNKKIVLVINRDDFDNNFSEKNRIAMFNSTSTRILYAKKPSDTDFNEFEEKCKRILEEGYNLLIFTNAYDESVIAGNMIRSRISSIVFAYNRYAKELALYTGLHDLLQPVKDDVDDIKGNYIVMKPIRITDVGDINLMRVARNLMLSYIRIHKAMASVDYDVACMYCSAFNSGMQVAKSTDPSIVGRYYNL